MSIQEGTIARFDTSAKPVTAINGTAVNPDLMVFTYITPDGTKTSYTWTNGTGDPTGHIVNYGTGLFYILIPTDGFPGTWTYSWWAKANGGADTTQTEVKWESTESVVASQT